MYCGSPLVGVHFGLSLIKPNSFQAVTILRSPAFVCGMPCDQATCAPLGLNTSIGRCEGHQKVICVICCAGSPTLCGSITFHFSYVMFMSCVEHSLKSDCQGTALYLVMSPGSSPICMLPGSVCVCKSPVRLSGCGCQVMSASIVKYGLCLIRWGPA